MFDRIAFIIAETFLALRRNLTLAFAAVTTVAISLYLVGGMIYAGSRAEAYLDTVPGRFEMTINLRKGVTVADVQRTAKYLRMAPGVRSVVWLPAARQWERLKKEKPEMTEGLGDENPLGESFRVRLSDLTKGDAVAAQAMKMSTVDKDGGVQYFKEAQSVVAEWIPFLRGIAYRIGGLLFIVSGILILNAIRLNIESRRVEIRIMRLVGASRIVVNLPFVLEGVLQGALGGALAAAGMQASQRVIEAKLGELSMGATLAAFPTTFAFGVLCGIGGGYGGLCSVLALRTPPRARHGG